MLITWHDQIIVDFVRDHQDSIGQTDFGNLLEFLPGPDPTGRIVRTAEDQHLGPVRFGLLLEIGKIDSITVPLLHQRAVHQLPSRIQDRMVHGIVDRSQQHDSISRLGIGFHRCEESIHHPMGRTDPFRFGCPLMPFFLPGTAGFPIRCRGIGIPQHKIIDFFLQCFFDFRRRFQFHIRYRKRNDVFLRTDPIPCHFLPFK